VALLVCSKRRFWKRELLRSSGFHSFLFWLGYMYVLTRLLQSRYLTTPWAIDTADVGVRKTVVRPSFRAPTSQFRITLKSTHLSSLANTPQAFLFMFDEFCSRGAVQASFMSVFCHKSTKEIYIPIFETRLSPFCRHSRYTTQQRLIIHPTK
jgi:hypothetical protein